MSIALIAEPRPQPRPVEPNDFEEPRFDGFNLPLFIMMIRPRGEEMRGDLEDWSPVAERGDEIKLGRRGGQEATEKKRRTGGAEERSRGMRGGKD